MSSYDQYLSNAFSSMFSSPPPSTPTPAQIAETLKQHAKEGKDLSVVHAALDKIKEEAETKERTKKPLQGVAELTKQGAKPRRFVIAYKHGDISEVKAAHGIEYKDGLVHVENKTEHPYAVRGDDKSMSDLRRNLDSSNIAHHVEYID